MEAVVRVTRFAVARAKSEARDRVTPDDLLAGALQVIGRFGVVAFGPVVIDLAELGIDSREPESREKVAYSKEASAIFDQAAEIARIEGAASVDCVHLLAAYADVDSGLMARLKEVYKLDSAGWRAALARWASDSPRDDRGSRDLQSLLSPDAAAAVLGIHTQTLRGYIKNGKLPAYRLAGERAIRIRRDDLMSLLEPLNPEEAS